MRSANPHLAGKEHNHSKGPLPLVIGVTGHRDLREEDLRPLQAQVRNVFEDLESRFPHTPFTILSSLTGGADQLVAQVALEFEATLIVPQPLPQEFYERDFTTPVALANFHTLREKASYAFDLPLVEGNTLVGISEAGEQRNRQYIAAGAYIARHSQIFFAIRNELTAEDVILYDGPTDVVRFRLEEIPAPYAPPRSPLESPERGPIHYIMTRRCEGGPAQDKLFSPRHILPTGARAEDYERIYERIEIFNRDTVTLNSQLAVCQDKSKNNILPAEEVAKLPPTLQRTLDRYAVADSLALHYSQLTSRTMASIFFCVFVAATCFNLFHALPRAHPAKAAATTVRDKTTEPTSTTSAGAELHTTFPPEATKSWTEFFVEVPWFLVLSLLLGAFCSYGLYAPARKGDYQNKYQDYRALAEGLRVQFFWHLVGLPDSVADYYLGKQRSELEWIRNAIRTWNIDSPWYLNTTPNTLLDTSDQQIHGLQLARRYWVNEQKAYFSHKAHIERESLERDEQKINYLLQLSIGLAVLLVSTQIIPLLLPLTWLIALKEAVEQEWIHAGVMLCIGLSALAAGLMHGHNQQRTRAEHAKRFERMSILYTHAAKRLDERIDTYREARNLIHELGKEALVENGDWVLLHRERPLEVPHAG